MIYWFTQKKKKNRKQRVHLKSLNPEPNDPLRYFAVSLGMVLSECVLSEELQCPTDPVKYTLLQHQVFHVALFLNTFNGGFLIINNGGGKN